MDCSIKNHSSTGGKSTFTSSLLCQPTTSLLHSSTGLHTEHFCKNLLQTLCEKVQLKKKCSIFSSWLLQKEQYELSIVLHFTSLIFTASLPCNTNHTMKLCLGILVFPQTKDAQETLFFSSSDSFPCTSNCINSYRIQITFNLINYMF